MSTFIQGPSVHKRADQHFLTLDGYRGVAAFFVVVMHICEQIGFPYAGNAMIAVDFFFILSGFVIALSYENRLFSGSMNLRSFLRLRYIRLYPMILMGALLGILARFIEGRFSIQSILFAGLFAMLLLPLPRIHSDGDSFPINGPGWSLTYEFLVNLIFAAFVRFLRGKKLIVIMLLAVGVEIWLAFHSDILTAAVSWRGQWKAFLRALAPFLLGVTLFHHRGRAPARHGNLWPIMGSIGLAVALTCWVSSKYYVLGCIYLLFPLLIWTGTCQPSSKWLRQAMTWLGEISYPIYAINEPLARLYKRACQGPLANIHSRHLFALLIVFSALTTAISWLLAQWFDKPARAWLRARL